MRLGVHDFDLLEWVTDRPVASVRATGADGALRAEGYDTEDVVAGVATLGNGVPVTVTLGYCVPDGHPGSIVGTRVVGTGGVAEVDGAPAASRQWTDDGGTAADTHLWPTVEGTPAGALANESHAFLDAVRSRGPSPVPYAAGRRAVAVARAFERAADTGDPQTVE